MTDHTNANRYEYKGRMLAAGSVAGSWHVEENRDGEVWHSRAYPSRIALEQAITKGYPIRMRPSDGEEDGDTEGESLYILWTNPDPATSRQMVMMYATNSMLRGWWKEVTVIIWGGTAKLAVEDAVIRDSINSAQYAGVEFTACIACAANLGVKDKLEEMGVEVVPWGTRLTRLLKEKRNLLTI